MSNVHKISSELAIVDLTDRSINRHAAKNFERNQWIIARRTIHRTELIDLAKNDRQDFNTPLIDLTKDGDSHSNSIVPFIDLTGDDDQFTEYRVPVVDLTVDDAMDTSDQIECIDLTIDDTMDINGQTGCIDLTNDEASSGDSSVNLTGNYLNHSLGFTAHYNQMHNPNSPVINLTYENSTLAENRALVFDRKPDDVMNIARQLQHISLMENQRKQYSTTERSPIDLTRDNSQSIHKTTHLIYSEGSENYRRPVLTLTQESIVDNIKSCNLTDNFIQSFARLQSDTVDDVEMHDDEVKTGNNFTTNIQENIAASHSRIPVENVSYNVNECDIFKRNECSNTNSTDNRNGIQRINGKKEMLLTNSSQRQVKTGNNFTTNIQESIAASHSRIPVENASYDVNECDIFKRNECSNTNSTDNRNSIQRINGKKEMLLTNSSQRDNFGENDLSSRKSEKMIQNNSFMKPDRQLIPYRHSLGSSTVNTSENVLIEKTDASENAPWFLKPARHPIPFRHSLGRSIVNTSENVPIEYTDDSEGVPRTMTVSSVFHRKTSKSSNDISKQILSDSSEPRADTFATGDIQEFLLKIYIVFVIFFIFYIIWYY